MAADPLNVRQQASRLDTRKQFYSQRVVDGWNKVPTDIKKIGCVTVNSFKMTYKNTEESWRQPRRESRLEEGGGGCPPMESTLIVSERSQWDDWVHPLQIRKVPHLWKVLESTQ
jgi:hypothetical protein